MVAGLARGAEGPCVPYHRSLSERSPAMMRNGWSTVMRRKIQTVRCPAGLGSIGRQRKLLLETLEARTLPSWTPLGRAPVTNGQTAGSLAVSGRVTAVAPDVTDA